MSLLSLARRRLIVVTGKGGVGKSTLTAALGRALAAAGRRVLLLEILSDVHAPSALQRALGGPALAEEPRPAAPGLWAAALTAAAGHHRFLEDALPLKVLAEAALRSQAVRRFLTAAPGFPELGVLYRMLDLLGRRGPGGAPAFELCLLDAPATGHALALAQVPERLARLVPAGPIARAAAEGTRLLKDPGRTGCLVVTLPERLAVTEAQELEEALTARGLPVAGVVVNRVPVDPFGPEERAALEAVLPGAGAFPGVRELRRLERARAALGGLHSRRPPPVLLAEVDATGPEVAMGLAAELARSAGEAR